ncbi:SDR family NAD(P)-dependent oxidoreductase [Propionivibrio limicola]|uniref:SDR family NAD(P)-dependent oxidoreductase n=1 Tax=Propionivibrio limicola TaxID=167645 RepID=UPI001291F696|nr:3-oxoacyl-ACP reductase FabG [Propionivibrio limicola]
MRLKDKVALITGGGGDVAIAIAEKFLANGARVVLVDLKPELLAAAAQKLNAGAALATVTGDVCHLDDMEAAARLAVSQFGKLDIVVPCAGVIKHMPIDEMSLNDWKWVVDINLTGTFVTCKAAVPFMKQQQSGRIITISSVGGRTGRPKVGVNYAASKAGVNGLTMCLARELGAFNITVNSICPGPLAGRMTESMPPENLKALISTACIGRLGRPDDIGNAALYLASDEAEWVTGEILDVNGGVYI